MLRADCERGGERREWDVWAGEEGFVGNGNTSPL